MNRSKRQRTTRKLIVVAFAMICLFGMVVYAETGSWTFEDDTWSVNMSMSVISTKTVTKVSGAELRNTGKYAATATSYDKNGKNVAYQGAYSATKAVATAKANGVVKGTGKCWINDNQGSRITQIWQKTLSK